MKPICPFTPTSNLIIERSQITLDLVSKDVKKVVFKKMGKSIESGQVQCLTFTFSVLSKVHIYENLKNVLQEAMGKQSISNQTRHAESDAVENQSKVPLNLSSKNVKNAFFESMTSHKNESGVTSLTFIFTTLSIDPIYEEVDSQRESKGSKKNNPPPIPWATHPASRNVSNPLYELKEDPIYEELDSQRESEGSKKNNPPTLPSLATHPARRGIPHPPYELITKRKNPLEKIMGFFHKCFPKRSFPVPQARDTSYAFDSGCECGVGLNKALTIEKEHIYEIPRQFEPVIYLKVLP